MRSSRNLGCMRNILHVNRSAKRIVHSGRAGAGALRMLQSGVTVHRALVAGQTSNFVRRPSRDASGLLVYPEQLKVSVHETRFGSRFFCGGPNLMPKYELDTCKYTA